MIKLMHLFVLGMVLVSPSIIYAEDVPAPNIILILADDMGFSDIGSYGSEIETPHLDRLAQDGLRYTQFYNAARCCPTRASLLTGVYPHEAGMGWMDSSDVLTPAYQGDLGKDVRTIGEVLHTAGYATYMSGKWHVSSARKNEAQIKDNWPMQRGFDQFYGVIGGVADYFHPNALLGNDPVEHPEGRLLTETISDHAVGFIEAHQQEHPDQPFFLYLSYTAPHWPLHAREETVAKYKGFYDAGWDALREARFKKQKAIGLWADDVALSPRDPEAEIWDDLSADQKSVFARRMEIYAAQVDEMDQGIGDVLAAVEATGKADNTLIFFLSDNGASAEFSSKGKSKDLFGPLADTWESYRLSWANAGSTPFREYKHWIHEGGIRTPLIVRWPQGIDPKLDGHFTRDLGHIVDLMATCMEVSGASYPETGVKPLQGRSLNAHFTGGENHRGPMFWEHEANMGMRDGIWKLVAKTPENEPFSEERLELYNMEEDPSELNDLADRDPERVQQMYAAWTTWGEAAGIFPLDSRDWGTRQRSRVHREEE